MVIIEFLVHLFYRLAVMSFIVFWILYLTLKSMFETPELFYIHIEYFNFPYKIVNFPFYLNYVSTSFSLLNNKNKRSGNFNNKPFHSGHISLFFTL